MGQIVGIAIVWFIIEMLLWYLLAQFISGWLGIYLVYYRRCHRYFTHT